MDPRDEKKSLTHNVPLFKLKKDQKDLTNENIWPESENVMHSKNEIKKVLKVWIATKPKKKLDSKVSKARCYQLYNYPHFKTLK